MQIPVTAACAAICGLLILILAFRVSLLRMRHRVAIGDGGVEALARAIRVHANTIEFVPIFLLLSLCYELYAGANVVLIGLDAVFVAARIAFAVGFSLAPLHPLRRVGAGLSYLTLLLASTLLLAAVVTTF
ncbi:MAG: MAPEG family protein [Nevskia sp.]|nr:MAPEG family protein [Gammaproteobacteria bacterium]MDH4457125.1 MAPEG family protein [Nevskia sp.]